MMKNLLQYKFKIFLWVMLIFISFSVYANFLYTVTLPVTSHQSSVRNKAIIKAFKTVLIRVSGNMQIMQLTDNLTPPIDQPIQYVQEYSYLAQQSNVDNPLMLSIRFDAHAINKILKQLGQHILTTARPSTLIWLVVQEPDGTMSLINNDILTKFKQALIQTSQIRAFPILFPMMDIKTLATVTPSDVWVPFFSVIEKYSIPYQTNTILIIQINIQQSGALLTHWILFIQGAQSATWDVSGHDINNITAQGFNQLADIFEQQMDRLNNTTKVMIQAQVNGLSNMVDYAKTINYFQKLNMVKQVTPLKTSRTQASFQLTIQGDIEAFQQAILNSNFLKIVSVNQEQPVEQFIINYSADS